MSEAQPPAPPDRILLPKRLRAAEVCDVLEDLRRRGESAALVLDFAQVEEFDSSTLALLHYLRGSDPGVTAANLGGALARAQESFVRRLPAQPLPPPADSRGFVDRLLMAVADKFLRQMKSLGRFLAMFGDVVYHLGYYLKDRRGVYPGETWYQLFFMGYRSFPIVCLLLFLVGVTIAITAAEHGSEAGAGDRSRGELALARRRDAAHRELRSDRFDPTALFPEGRGSLTAMRMLLEAVLGRSAAVALLTREAALGRPFSHFDDLASYERAVLEVDA